jgi:hypothetical protein
MAQRARLVLDLVERIKKDKTGGSEPEEEDSITADFSSKKRAWDEGDPDHSDDYVRSYHYPPDTEVRQDTDIPPTYGNAPSYSIDDVEFKDPEARTLAEKDMMTIRSKRSAAAAVAAANASANTGQTNSGTASASGAPGDKSPKKNRKRGVSRCQS